MSALLVAVVIWSLAMGEDHSPLAVVALAAWIALLVFGWGALDLRWGEEHPWATALACTLLGQLGWIVGLAQWEYFQVASQGQVAGWSAALEGIQGFEQWPSLLLVGQTLGAAVLCRRGKVLPGVLWLNAGILFLFVWIPLYVACSSEEAIRRTLRQSLGSGESAPTAEGGAAT